MDNQLPTRLSLSCVAHIFLLMTMATRKYFASVVLASVFLTSCAQQEPDFNPSPVMESLNWDLFDSVADAVEPGVSNSGSSGGVGGHEPSSVVDKGTYTVIGSKRFPVESFLEKLKSESIAEIEKHSISASKSDTQVDEKVVGFFLKWKTEQNQGIMDFVYLGQRPTTKVFKGFENLNTIYTFRYLKIESPH